MQQFEKNQNEMVNFWNVKTSRKDMLQHFQTELVRNRETGIKHIKESESEFFFSLIKEGKTTEIRALFDDFKVTDFIRNFGRMSQNNLRNYRYLAIISISKSTEAAVKSGIVEEYVYTLSDVYYQKLDVASTYDEITHYFKSCIIELTENVAKHIRKHRGGVSKPINQAMAFIQENIHENLTLNEIAEEVSLSVSYLCNRFKEETGQTVSQFIHENKVEEAKKLIQFTDHSLLEISQVLGFCSQSHFSSVFSKITGLTPGKYKKAI